LSSHGLITISRSPDSGDMTVRHGF
jgi:hypothetical protein